jgi:hypothetical protein
LSKGTLIGSLFDPLEPIRYQALHETFTRFVRRALAASHLSLDERRHAARASVHWLRHTHATRAAEREVPADILQENLGQKDPRTTARYFRAQIERRQREMERAFAGARKPSRVPSHPESSAPAPMPVASNVISLHRAPQSEPGDGERLATIVLHLEVENNSSFVRGRTKALAEIERDVLSAYGMVRKADGCYELRVAYADDEDLDDAVFGILSEASQVADMRHCFIEAHAREEGSDRSW